MGYEKRLSKAFETAPVFSLHNNTRVVLFSDCHRGSGTSNDNFLKNRHLYMAALTYYYENGFNYIELGDGDELWENRYFQQIQEIHSDVFHLLYKLYCENRLYMIFGNHDMIKNKQLTSLKIPFYEGIILKDCCSEKFLYLTHGHQADTLNSVFWKLSRFLVRYLWKSLEQFGVLDPTSAAKNYSVKEKTEKRLEVWAEKNNLHLITGHTHRPILDTNHPHYSNTGSCVHPAGITCIEITHSSLSLIKWTLNVREDFTLYAARSILNGPIKI